MSYTEAEAKTKWCPFARVVAGRLCGEMMEPASDVGPHNRVQERGATEATTHAAMNCLASACMAWRWATSPDRVSRRFHQSDEFTATTEPDRPVRVPASWEWSPADTVEGEPPGWTEPLAEAVARGAKGFCGLAGQPS